MRKLLFIILLCTFNMDVFAQNSLFPPVESPIANGGTDATTAAQALSNLGGVSLIPTGTQNIHQPTFFNFIHGGALSNSIVNSTTSWSGYEKSEVTQTIMSGVTTPPTYVLPSTSYLATYASRDSVGLEVDSTSVVPLYTATSTSFTSTSVAATSLSGATILNGMTVDTAAGCDPTYPNDKCSGYVTGFSGDTITVSGGWVLVDGVGNTFVTPVSGTSIYVNPVNAIFGENIVMDLSSSAPLTTIEVGEEIDLQSFISGSQDVTGIDVVNDGTPQMDKAYEANGSNSGFSYGYYGVNLNNGVDILNFQNSAFLANHQTNYAYAFEYANGLLVQPPLWSVDTNGNVQANSNYSLNVSSIAAPATPTYTVYTTGGSLPAATLTYSVSSIDVNSAITQASPSVSFTTTGTTSSATLNWPVVPGATGYWVWLAFNGTEYYTQTNSITVTNDTGAAGTPPSSNGTGGGKFAGPLTLNLNQSANYVSATTIGDLSLTSGQNIYTSLGYDNNASDSIQVGFNFTSSGSTSNYGWISLPAGSKCTINTTGDWSCPAINSSGAVTAASVQTGGASGAVWTSGAAAPTAACGVGSMYSNTAATSTSTVLYVCYPANTWNAVTVP